MLNTHLLTLLLSALPHTHGSPFAPPSPSTTTAYNCGYVRTRWNSSAVAGVFAFSACTPFFFNTTTNDYQDAFAYTLYGGCRCQFWR